MSRWVKFRCRSCFRFQEKWQPLFHKSVYINNVLRMPKDLFPNMEKRIKSVRAIAGHYFSFCRYCHMPSDLVMPFRIKEFELYIEPPKKWVQVYLPEDVYIDKVGKYAPEGSDIVKCKSCGTWFMIFEKNNKYLGKCYKCGLTFMIFKPKGW